MPVGISNGDFHEDDFSHSASDFIAPEPETSPTEGLKKVYITRSSGTSESEPTSLPTADSIVSPGDDIHPTPDYLNPPDREVIPEADKPEPKVLFNTASPLVNITDQDIDTAVNVGLSAGPGTMKGVTAKTFDKVALAKAQDMTAAGDHPQDIWHETGNYKGVDGRWRQEIPDHQAVVKPNALETIQSGTYPNSKDIRLAHVLEHKDLYDAYPWAQNIKMKIDPNASTGASYDELMNTIRLGPKAVTPETILHEVQHAIQSREGFAKGGAEAKQFALRYEKEVADIRKEGQELLKISEKGPLTDKQSERAQFIAKVLTTDWARRDAAKGKAFENYKRLAGEVESRNTETRMLLDEMGRRKFFPEWTQDTKNSDQLISDKTVWTTPYGMSDNPMKAPN